MAPFSGAAAQAAQPGQPCSQACWPPGAPVPRGYVSVSHLVGGCHWLGPMAVTGSERAAWKG